MSLDQHAADCYGQRCETLIAELRAARATAVSVGLAKNTSNLFRRRKENGKRKLDVRAFGQVLGVDKQSRLADVEGMTTYDRLVDATLLQGLLPAVVPQLKTITVGGAVSGIGIESSSFRFGLVHETVEQMEVLLGDGSLIRCSAHERPDLFYGFPNSYGTLGYALRLTLRLIAAAPAVRITHTRFSDPVRYFDSLAQTSQDPGLDYLDGTVFSATEMYMTEGRLCDSTPRLSDYTYMDIYYRSIQRMKEDWLTARDYIWRWDTDWFWCSKQFGVQNPVVRILATKRLLNSRTYQRVMRLAQRLGHSSAGAEAVIQDVDVPVEQGPEFLRFLLAEIGITPIWICPVRARDPNIRYDLYALDPDILYINFGFWGVVRSEGEGFLNRKVERKMLELGGKKGLYSTSWFDEETFWRLYNRDSYQKLKQKYDPGGVFPDLYAKCVGGR
jgi:FAD/FMN-containing dehydrogenase